MYQKGLIRSVWKSAGLDDENDSKLQQLRNIPRRLSEALRRSLTSPGSSATPMAALAAAASTASAQPQPEAAS
jgi:hypothetical protein